jgi:hypothetical protein
MSDKHEHIEQREHFWYFKETDLYMLWHYLNAYRFFRGSTLTFEDLAPLDTDEDSTALMFLPLMSSLNLEIDGLEFQNTEYDKLQTANGYADISSLMTRRLSCCKFSPLPSKGKEWSMD